MFARVVEANPWHQTFGFATEEFEVTAERLGVYLPVVCESS